MGARAVDRSGPSPLWAQVEADLRRRAEDGEFDAAFPGENVLVTQYEVSRNTVREALRSLRAEGLVTAERGRPQRLARGHHIAQPMSALYSLFSSVEAAGQRQRSVVRRLELTADGVVAAQIGLEESTPLLHLERLRLADEQPLALDRVWLPAAAAEPLLAVDFSHTSLYGELAARCGVRVDAGQERVRAVVPSAALRELLACPPDTAVFAITRVGWAAGTCVEWRQTVVRGDRYLFEADFSARGYRLTGAIPTVSTAGRRAS